jgi:hypothetical protein
VFVVGIAGYFLGEEKGKIIGWGTAGLFVIVCCIILAVLEGWKAWKAAVPLLTTSSNPTVDQKRPIYRKLRFWLCKHSPIGVLCVS